MKASGSYLSERQWKNLKPEWFNLKSPAKLFIMSVHPTNQLNLLGMVLLMEWWNSSKQTFKILPTAIIHSKMKISLFIIARYADIGLQAVPKDSTRIWL